LIEADKRASLGPANDAERRIFDMTTLTPTRGPLERVPYSSGRRDAVGAGPAQVTMIKRFCMCALAALVAGGAVAGIVALKTAIYFWRFNYY
jgi:hypothetical protein